MDEDLAGAVESGTIFVGGLKTDFDYVWMGWMG